uniref:Putative secreted protein n=1 Tax=Hemileia vastatrix TaxID=203904 RepID=T1UMQ5_9BASI|nr:putative secreted protein [Hemileia vastatrix]
MLQVTVFKLVLLVACVLIDRAVSITFGRSRGIGEMGIKCGTIIPRPDKMKASSLDDCIRALEFFKSPKNPQFLLPTGLREYHSFGSCEVRLLHERGPVEIEHKSVIEKVKNIAERCHVAVSLDISSYLCKCILNIIFVISERQGYVD